MRVVNGLVVLYQFQINPFKPNESRIVLPLSLGQDLFLH